MKTQTTSPTPHVQPTLIETLPLESVEVGDIVATASDAVTSGGIRWATNADFSHAILCLKNKMAVDAMPGAGVTKDFLSDKLQGSSTALVFRHRTATLEQKELAANWAAAQVGREYDELGAARVGLQPGARTFPLRFTPHGHLISAFDEFAGMASSAWHDASFFCSELIFRAFEVAQAPIIPGRAHVAGPGLLRRVKTVQFVGELKVFA